MSTTLTAPDAMNRREQVADLLRALPVGGVSTLVIAFSDDSSPTTSYLDELIRQTLAEGVVEWLRLVHADGYTAELASAAARRFAVAERLTVVTDD